MSILSSSQPLQVQTLESHSADLICNHFVFKPQAFTTEELEVHDLSSLIDILQSLEGEPTKTVIRGKVLSDASEIISRDKEDCSTA